MFKYTFKRYLFKILNITVQKGIQEKIHKNGHKNIMSYFNTKGKNIISHIGTNMGKNCEWESQNSETFKL